MQKRKFTEEQIIRVLNEARERRMDPDAKPALRISHIVYGRTRVGQRVKYLVDPHGGGTTLEIPENVVLIRWRKRVFPGYSFSGDRLSPSLWRALPEVLGDDVEAWREHGLDFILTALQRKRPGLKTRHLSPPSAEAIRALLEVCSAKQLRALVERHRDPSRWQAPGVPDLFLFARSAKAGASMGRFVEVKKPEEKLAGHQEEEIEFMRGLGLHARVLRLVEREA